MCNLEIKDTPAPGMAIQDWKATMGGSVVAQGNANGATTTYTFPLDGVCIPE